MWPRIRHYLIGLGLLLSGFLVGIDSAAYILTHKFLDTPIIILVALVLGTIIGWIAAFEGKSHV